ncbi:hypothetical protein [Burkholderia cepacia]|uniref:hypothetical protein n=1 Tax=Burkholderia cepacia TaxID=292 RepID=UPI001588B604|nr:hypothetical protein [Burkholderia cepacia]
MTEQTTKIKDVNFITFFNELKKLDSIQVENGGFYTIKEEGKKDKYAFYIQQAPHRIIQFCGFNAIELFSEYDAERAYAIKTGKLTTTPAVDLVHELYDLVLFRKQVSDALNNKETVEVKKVNKI